MSQEVIVAGWRRWTERLALGVVVLWLGGSTVALAIEWPIGVAWFGGGALYVGGEIWIGFALLVPLVRRLLPVTGALRADVDVVRRARRGACVVHRRSARWLGVLLRIESLGMPSVLSVHGALLGRSRRVLRAAEPA